MTSDPLFTRLPTDGVITGHFGDLYPDGSGGYYHHRGVDFGVPVGTPVYAPGPGTVVSFYNDGSFGNAICIDLGTFPWRFCLLAHNETVLVQVGQQVEAGQLIAHSGQTGFVTGPHVHWQLSNSSSFPVDITQSIDPLQFYHPEEEMTPAQAKMLQDVYDAMVGRGNPAGQAVLDRWNSMGNSFAQGYTIMWNNLFTHCNAQQAHNPGLPPWQQYAF